MTGGGMGSLWRARTAAEGLTAKLARDNTDAFAAKATLFLFLSLFPFVMLLLTLVQYLPFTREEVTGVAAAMLPEALSGYAQGLMEELYRHSGGTVLPLTVVSTLWAASKGVVAILQGLDAVYEVPRRRPWWQLRLVSLVYTVLFLLFLTACLGVLVCGNSLAQWLRRAFPSLQSTTWGILSWRNVVGALLLLAFFLLLYRAAPRRRSRLLAELPGALLSTLGWMGFSYLFSYYIDHFGHYANLYGSLTAVVLLMLWLYACMYILLLGAQVNRLRQTGGLPTRLGWRREPAQPREPIQPREPAKPRELIQPREPAQPPAPAKPREPIKPREPTRR